MIFFDFFVVINTLYLSSIKIDICLYNICRNATIQTKPISHFSGIVKMYELKAAW